MTDDLLVYRVKNGDLQAYEILVERYQHMVYNLACRMVGNEEDARDLAQDTFIVAYRSLPNFKGNSKFSTWLCRIASNKCLDFLRKRKTEGDKIPLFDSREVFISDSRGSPEEAAMREDESRKLKKILASLPKDYRIVLILHHYQQLSYKEIAEILDIPVKTVATRLYRAKIILREKLAGGETGEVQAGQEKPDKLHSRGVSLI